MTLTDSALRIAVVYPELLGTYADRGNATVLLRRALWRDQPASLVPVPAGSAVPSECDLYLLGGAEDAGQVAAMTGLRLGAGLEGAISRGAPVLAVCAGMQLLGETFEVGPGTTVPGLGLLDIVSRRLGRRAVGEVIVNARPELGIDTITGFENHACGSELGPAAQPLGQVVTGEGNGLVADRIEGVTQGSVVGTYLHGPVLVRNPALADLLLSRALGQPLAPLDLDSVTSLRVGRLTSPGRPRRRGLRSLVS